MEIHPKKGPRLSLQICRVVAELEVLHRLGEATATDIYIAIRDCVPKRPCRRTVFRDIEALRKMGFIEVEATTVWVNQTLFRLNRYRLATPVMLLDSIARLKTLTGKQKGELTKGVS
jgi:hypothetical protein